MYQFNLGFGGEVKLYPFVVTKLSLTYIQVRKENKKKREHKKQIIELKEKNDYKEIESKEIELENIIQEEDWKYVSNKYIYFDIETYNLQCSSGFKHTPYLVVAMYNYSNDVFKFKNISEFCDWLFKKDKKDEYIHRAFTIIAHNAKGYDNVFIKK